MFFYEVAFMDLHEPIGGYTGHAYMMIHVFHEPNL